MNPQEPQNENQDVQPGSQPPYQPSQGQYQPQPQSGRQYGQNNSPQVVYMTRPIEPQKQQMSPEIMQKHEESKKLYPKLNLSSGEYIISAIRRHPIGLVSIWSVTAAVVIALLVVIILLASYSHNQDLGGATPIPVMYLAIPALLIAILAILFGFISSVVYRANRFYLTNESVIQHIQTSLFNEREQTISLNNVEDASYSQDGILCHLLNYGRIRLSTMGDETTYRFSYVTSPKQQIALLNNAVEDFKNVRPLE